MDRFMKMQILPITIFAALLASGCSSSHKKVCANSLIKANQIAVMGTVKLPVVSQDVEVNEYQCGSLAVAMHFDAEELEANDPRIFLAKGTSYRIFLEPGEVVPEINPAAEAITLPDGRTGQIVADRFKRSSGHKDFYTGQFRVNYAPGITAGAVLQVDTLDREQYIESVGRIIRKLDSVRID